MTKGFAQHGGRPGATLRKSARNRGVTLVEAILYLTISSSVLLFSARILESERSRQQNAVSAADLRQVITSSQMFVAVKYDDIRRKLVKDTPLNAPIVHKIPMSEVVDAGFLPEIFIGGGAGMRKIHGQEYELVARAVLRNPPVATEGGTVPPDNQMTVIKSEGTILTGPEGGPYVIKPELMDRRATPAIGAIPANDELDLEVILVTKGGPGAGVKVQDGNRIVDLTQLPSAGFMTLEVPPAVDEGKVLAKGPYGGWTLDMEPYASTGLVQHGRFASLIALSRYGVLSTVPKDESAAEGVARCADVPEGIVDHVECSVRNEVYSNVVFNSWDSDGDGKDDSFPTIQNAYGISFADKVEGSTDAQISNLLSISCLAGGSVAAVIETLSVNCPTTSVQGLRATSVNAENVNISGTMTVLGRPLDADPSISGYPAFQVSEGVVTVSQQLDVEGTLNLDGNSIAPKLAATSSIWKECATQGQGCFVEGEPATVLLDICPTGSQRVVTAAPVAFPMSDDVSRIEVDVSAIGTEGSRSEWSVSLKRTLTTNNGQGNTFTSTDINPEGTQLLIQSLCEVSSAGANP